MTEPVVPEEDKGNVHKRSCAMLWGCLYYLKRQTVLFTEGKLSLEDLRNNSISCIRKHKRIATFIQSRNYHLLQLDTMKQIKQKRSHRSLRKLQFSHDSTDSRCNMVYDTGDRQRKFYVLLHSREWVLDHIVFVLQFGRDVVYYNPQRGCAFQRVSSAHYRVGDCYNDNLLSPHKLQETIHGSQNPSVGENSNIDDNHLIPSNSTVFTTQNQKNALFLEICLLHKEEEKISCLVNPDATVLDIRNYICDQENWLKLSKTKENNSHTSTKGYKSQSNLKYSEHLRRPIHTSVEAPDFLDVQRVSPNFFDELQTFFVKVTPPTFQMESGSSSGSDWENAFDCPIVNKIDDSSTSNGRNKSEGSTKATKVQGTNGIDGTSSSGFSDESVEFPQDFPALKFTEKVISPTPSISPTLSKTPSSYTQKDASSNDALKSKSNSLIKVQSSSKKTERESSSSTVDSWNTDEKSTPIRFGNCVSLEKDPSNNREVERKGEDESNSGLHFGDTSSSDSVEIRKPILPLALTKFVEDTRKSSLQKPPISPHPAVASSENSHTSLTLTSTSTTTSIPLPPVTQVSPTSTKPSTSFHKIPVRPDEMIILQTTKSTIHNRVQATLTQIDSICMARDKQNLTPGKHDYIPIHVGKNTKLSDIFSNTETMHCGATNPLRIYLYLSAELQENTRASWDEAIYFDNQLIEYITFLIDPTHQLVVSHSSMKDITKKLRESFRTMANVLPATTSDTSSTPDRWGSYKQTFRTVRKSRRDLTLNMLNPLHIITSRSLQVIPWEILVSNLYRAVIRHFTLTELLVVSDPESWSITQGMKNTMGNLKKMSDVGLVNPYYSSGRNFDTFELKQRRTETVRRALWPLHFDKTTSWPLQPVSCGFPFPSPLVPRGSGLSSCKKKYKIVNFVDFGEFVMPNQVLSLFQNENPLKPTFFLFSLSDIVEMSDVLISLRNKHPTLIFISDSEVKKFLTALGKSLKDAKISPTDWFLHLQDCINQLQSEIFSPIVIFNPPAVFYDYHL
eukprot:TRINITY_DN14823_c0_g1_i1.p1 TRINITY_DN14823_c0_g1~~TRINITY_DN14823_c0_g1_i1.p1  ORF type:complete len:1017 (+),score=177.63 TRINITY_DN14823_c0_g1_i1:789-3839(+)